MKRRDFLGRLAAGAAALGVSRAFPALGGGQAQTIPIPGSDPLALRAVTRTIEVNGKAARVFGLMAGTNSGLTVDAGRTLALTLSNELGSPTLIHWHGLTPPWNQDGVPDNPAALLTAGDARRYALPTRRGGTQWMHAHTLQEQNLLAAPLIVRTEADRRQDEQEVVILLHHFSFTPAEEILARLQRTASSGHGGMAKPVPGDGMGHAGMNHAGTGSGTDGTMTNGGMAGTTPDLNDIEYDAYLANDRTLNDPEV
ncbi:MAG: copper oxidase, partial [Xanthobacter sp. 35-67-6]